MNLFQSLTLTERGCRKTSYRWCRGKASESIWNAELLLWGKWWRKFPQEHSHWFLQHVLHSGVITAFPRSSEIRRFCKADPLVCGWESTQSQVMECVSVNLRSMKWNLRFSRQRTLPEQNPNRTAVYLSETSGELLLFIIYYLSVTS